MMAVLQRWMHAVHGQVLPSYCVMCDAKSGAQPLCHSCLVSLPAAPRPACSVCALPTPEGSICGQCLKNPPYFDATHSVWLYHYPVDKLIHELKFHQQLSLAAFFARALVQSLSQAKVENYEREIIIPMPLSEQRLIERGFNQAIEIARVLTKIRKVAISNRLCSRVRNTAAQSALPWKERKKNVLNAFECSEDLRGFSVTVVDDVMTTGATLNELAKALKRHGAVLVRNWVIARAVRN